jgi:integrase
VKIVRLVDAMSGRDRLIVRIFLVLGRRPGELFALRREDRVGPNQIRVDESTSPISGIVEAKTDASDAFVWDQRPEAFLFASRSDAGHPSRRSNFLSEP